MMPETTTGLRPEQLAPLPDLPSGCAWPTLAEQADPRTARIGVDPDLLRISWQTRPPGTPETFGPPRTVEFLPDLTGVPARIIGLCGDAFPARTPAAGSEYGARLLHDIASHLPPALLPPLGPTLWHYAVTAPTLRAAASHGRAPGDRLAALVIPSTHPAYLGAGIRLRQEVPLCRVAVASHTNEPLPHDSFSIDATIHLRPERLRAWGRLLGSPGGRDLLHRRGVAPDMLPVLASLHRADQIALLGAIDLAAELELTRHEFVFILLGVPQPEADRPDVPDLRIAGLLAEAALSPTARAFRELRHSEQRALHSGLTGTLNPELGQAMRRRQFADLLEEWAEAVDAHILGSTQVSK